MVDWGNVPSWISAVSGTLAFGAAGGAGWVAYRQLQAVLSTNSDRADEATKEQASRVAAWLELGEDDLFHVYVLNRSDLPIYKTVLTFVSPNNHNAFPLQVIPPSSVAWEPGRVSALVNEADRMHAPHLRLSYMFSMEGEGRLSQPGVPDAGPIGPVGVTLSFTDSQARRWHRNRQGDLTRVEQDFEMVEGGVL